MSQIYSWIDGNDEPRVFWLNGQVGTGKSTIARTVARRQFELGNLAASFFFSRGGGEASRADKFATTIALQLAQNYPVCRRHIYEIIKEYPEVLNLQLQEQWERLVLPALSRVDTATILVVVVDALDECDNEEDFRKLIGLLVEAQKQTGPSLRIFLTSTPEVSIRCSFKNVSQSLHRSSVLHHVDSCTVDADIKIYLEDELRRIGGEHGLPADWPSSEAVHKMVHRAGGLFIYAATALQYIEKGYAFTPQRLGSFVNNGGGDVHSGLNAHLDEIYSTVLQKSLRPNWSQDEKNEHCEALKLILGTLVVLESPLTVQSLDALLKSPMESIEPLMKGIRPSLDDLHAIIDVPADIPADWTQSVRLHHRSFNDFLLDRTRCTDKKFLVDGAQANYIVTKQCLEIMRRFFQQDEWLNRTTRSKMSNRVFAKEICPLEMEYACHNWVRHLQRSGSHFPGEMQTHEKQARIFLDEHAINWAIMLTRWDKDLRRVDDIYELEHQMNVSPPNARLWIKH